MHQTPDRIQLHKKSQTLELQFGQEVFILSAEFLRVHSPSAEVKGHGPNQAILQFGKSQVGITHIEATGNYGIRLYFDDSHNSGIYSWDFLYHLGSNQQLLQNEYEEELHKQGKSRHPQSQVLHFPPPNQ